VFFYFGFWLLAIGCFSKFGANIYRILAFLLRNLRTCYILGWFFCVFCQNSPYMLLGVPEIECEFGIEVHDGHFAVVVIGGGAYPRMPHGGGFFHFVY
jgi:hypothetical protein